MHRKVTYIVAVFFMFLNLSICNAKNKVDVGHHPSVCVAFSNDEPYQYVTEKGGLPIYKGFDIEMFEALLGLETVINYKYLNWSQTITALQKGTCDFALGAFYSKERAKDFYFSKPYRVTTDKFFYTDQRNDKFKNFNALAHSAVFKQQKYGIVADYIYTNPSLNLYIKNHPERFEKFKDEQKLLESIMQKNIHGFFADSVVMELLLWRTELHKKIHTSKMDLGSLPVRYMASKKTVSVDFINELNGLIDNYKKSSAYEALVRIYRVPLFIAMTTDTTAYHILEILGTMFYAISGLLLAREAKFSLTGAFILAMLPGIGGGVMRDIILDRDPVGILRTPMYFLTVVLTTLFFYIFIRLSKKIKLLERISAYFHHHMFVKQFSIVRATDAVGLAVFTIIGVMVSVEVQLEPLLLWSPVIAVLSSTGGGIVRDFFMGRELNKTFFYETAYVWSLLLTAYLIVRAKTISSTEMFYVIMITFLGIITTRVTILKNGWTSKTFWLDSDD